MHLNSKNIDDLLITPKQKYVIAEYSKNELINIKRNSYLYIKKLIDEVTELYKSIKSEDIRLVVDSNIRGLKKAIEGNASFVVELYYRTHTYEEFQEEAADIFGYRLIVCFLLEMYKLANKPLLTIGEDYNVVMNIVDRTKECCSSLNIFSITKEKLEEIMNNPDSRKNIDYGVDANIDYKRIICDDIVIDSIPYYIAFIVKNPLRTTNLVILNEVNVYYKLEKYIELKESSKKKGGI